MHPKSPEIHSKVDPWRALGPLWIQRVFQDVSQGDFFSNLGALWAPLGALRVPLGSTLEHFGSPRVSFWSFFGTFWHHLGNLGQLVEIAIFLRIYYNLDHFGEPWDVTFSQNFKNLALGGTREAIFHTSLQL